MSEEKQLTVAEILAKARSENPDAGSRRRRRRSLEDGGVSVAELTGSLKKVEARPVEARHSSVPIDAPSTNPQTTANEPAKPAAAQATPAAKPAATPKPSVAPKPSPATENTAVIRKVTTTSQPRSGEAKQPVQAPKASQAAKPEQAPKTDAPRAFPEPKPAAQPKPVTQPGPTNAETAVIPAVRNTAAPRTETVRSKAARTETVRAEAERPEFTRPEEGSYETDSFDLFDEEPRQQPAASDDTVPAASDDTVLVDDTVPADDIVIEDDSVNPIVLVLLVFLGVLAGVLGFLAFQWIWAHTSTIVAVLLGIVAVAAVVFGVRAMRTGRDTMTMILAGLAAAVAAFGPGLL